MIEHEIELIFKFVFSFRNLWYESKSEEKRGGKRGTQEASG